MGPLDTSDESDIVCFSCAMNAVCVFVIGRKQRLSE